MSREPPEGVPTLTHDCRPLLKGYNLSEKNAEKNA